MFDEVKERALKIAEAVYRTTDLFSDAEPLKWSLRQAALEIMSISHQDIGRLESLIKNILLKLELSSSGTFVFRVNYDVIKREYSNLLKHALSIKDSYRTLLDNIVSNTSDKVLVEAKEYKEKAIAEEKPEGREDVVLSIVAANGNSKRKLALVAALKQKGPSSVSDLTKLLTETGVNVSEKTIQRELVVLASVGEVKYEGDKRWRRYFV